MPSPPISFERCIGLVIRVILIHLLCSNNSCFHTKVLNIPACISVRYENLHFTALRKQSTISKIPVAISQVILTAKGYFGLEL
jgi:hypothetical protein